MSVLCTLVLFSCLLIGGRNKVIYNTVSAERIILAEDFEKLEEVSDLIVKVRVLEGKENVLVEAPGEEGGVLYGYTLTKLEILDIFKGDEDSGTISITE